ncbi:unnamed protein product [Meloidogyne enterolobii]|uniref:Uncharacterized protein n=1 Tax=Meloidogyne enterolobii TaxID=390850 RepID=A0ACB0ZHN8_MELEN
MIDSHHFYFAFENSVCVNYVTEKFWRLKSLIVPVVLSRKIFEGLNIPNDSFIAADDFKSPKDLASFLEKLAADKERYKSYFRWTKKYKKTKNTNNISNPLCNLCKMAHIDNNELKIKNIYDFWNGGGKCQHGFALNVLLASEPEASGGNVGLIIGGVIAVVVLLALVSAIVWFFVLRKKGEEEKGMEIGMTAARGMKTNKVGATQATIGEMTTIGGMQAKTGGATPAGGATSKASGTTKGGATSKPGGATSKKHKNVR